MITLQPKELTLMITNACNCRCSYCCERGLDNAYNTDIVSKDIIKKCIDILALQDHGFLAMFGGEATLHMELLEFALKYFQNNYPGSTLKFGMTTNGVNITDRVIKWMNDVSEVTEFEVLVSLDGCEISHNMHRKTASGKETYDIVIENIKRMKESCPNIKISRHAVLTRYDLQHMDEVCRTSIEIHPICFDQTYAFMMLGPRSSTDEEYTREDWDSYVSFYYKYVKPDNSPLFSKSQMPAVRRIFKSSVDSHPNDRYDGRMWESCHAGYDEFLVDTNGVIYPCVKYFSELAGTDFPVLNIMDFNPTLNISDDHHYSLYKKHHDDQESFVTRFKSEYGYECKDCPAMTMCTWCIGHGECHTGDPYTRPKSLCDRFLLFSEIDAKYQLEYYKKQKEHLIAIESKLMYEIEHGTKVVANQVVEDNGIIRTELMNDEY